MRLWAAAMLLALAVTVGCSGGSKGTTPDDARGSADQADEADSLPADALEGTDDSGGATGTWGWISVIETNDFWEHVYIKNSGWFGGVRAYFAVRPSWPRALGWDLGFARAAGSAGACTLYDTGVFVEGCEDCFCLDKGLECQALDDSGRWCGPDEMCVLGPERPETWPDRGICQALPPHFDVGTVTVKGAKVAISMTPDPYDRYMQPGLPDSPELFDQGDLITARTSGGALAPLKLSVPGVAHLVLGATEEERGLVHVRPGHPSVVTWKPGDPDSRILVVLRVGSHDPYPVAGAIVCETDDAAGQVEVSADLIDQLLYLACSGTYVLKTSVIYRYRRDVKTLSDGAVELFVASARGLQMVFD